MRTPLRPLKLTRRSDRDVRPIWANRWLPRWPGPSEPLPSAFAVLATPACLDCWTTQQLVGVLARSVPSRDVAYWGWEAVATVAEPLGKLLHRRPETLRLGAQLRDWYPRCLQALLPLNRDPTETARLRFCHSCLAHGYHSPLFQLPWWDECPVHAEPLAEGCPQCDALLPAGLALEDPAHWLRCQACGFRLSDPGRLIQPRHGTPPAVSERWWACVADYFRWLRATQDSTWLLAWEVEGEGCFDDVARVAGRALAKAVPPPSNLQRHLVDRRPHVSARAWSRKFLEPLKRPSVRALGFSTAKDMQAAGRYFYGALPVPTECFDALHRCHRHLRRKVGVNILGRKSPDATPGDEYLWKGQRPLAVLGFRLLTGLTSIDRVKGVGYLDFRAVELVREPPASLAQELLAAWTGVDLRPLRNWPKERAFVLQDQNWAMSGSRPSPPVRRDPMPHGALRWLYSRTVVEAWHDVALECFARAHPQRTVAWRCGEEPRKRAQRTRPVAVPVILPVTEHWAEPKQREHPMLVHARADRERPRGWAAAILRLGTGEGYPVVAMLGRSAPAPFASYASSWNAYWTWPEELHEESQRDRASA